MHFVSCLWFNPFVVISPTSRSLKTLWIILKYFHCFYLPMPPMFRLFHYFLWFRSLKCSRSPLNHSTVFSSLFPKYFHLRNEYFFYRLATFSSFVKANYPFNFWTKSNFVVVKQKRVYLNLSHHFLLCFLHLNLTHLKNLRNAHSGYSFTA